MRYDIIHINGFMYAVDKEAVINVNDYVATPSQILKVGSKVALDHYYHYLSSGLGEKWDKILYSNDPSLGLPLLPEPKLPEDFRWIPIGDKLPTEGEAILIFMSKFGKPDSPCSWYEGFYENGKWQIITEDGLKKDADNNPDYWFVTHWSNVPFVGEIVKKFTEEDVRNAYRNGFHRGGSSFPEDYFTENEQIDYLTPKPVAVELEVASIVHKGGIVANDIFNLLVVNNYVQVKQWYYNE